MSALASDGLGTYSVNVENLCFPYRLQPGQTLWRLARAYGVSLDELMLANHINDPDTLEVGQSVYIPGATTLLDVPPYPAPLRAAGTACSMMTVLP